MPTTVVSSDGTLVSGITGGSSYHALLARTAENAPITVFAPSVLGTTKEDVASGVGLTGSGGTPVLLIPRVFVAHGIGGDYTYQSSAVTDVGASLSPGSTNPPVIAKVEGGYTVTKTWFSFGGTAYIPDAPFDQVLFLGSSGGGAALTTLVGYIEDFEKYGLHPVYVNGVKVPSPPTTEEKTYAIATMLQAWVATFPASFEPDPILEKIGVLAKNKSLTTFQNGSRSSGATDEALFRTVVASSLVYMAQVISDHFGNEEDSTALLRDIDVSLHDRLTSKVLILGRVQIDTVTRDKFRDESLRILKSVISILAECLS